MDTDINVRILQEAIRKISYTYDEIPLIIPDGIYGEETKDAVKTFQTIYGLKPTGEADFDTWTLIFLVKGYINENNIDFIGPDPENLKLGDNNEFVYVVQILLKELTEKYVNFNLQVITGNYDMLTKENITLFQRLSRIPETGEVDMDTFNYLVGAYKTSKG